MKDTGSGKGFSLIPPERFANFHAEFHGDTWDVCGRCGGKCEINKIGSLMPGEPEYIAGTLGITADDFRDKYLDGIETPFGVIDVLKMKPGCPFLSPDFKCIIKDVKVVLCDVYPIVFNVENEKVVFSVDSWCPIVRYVPELSRRFEEEGIPALKKLNVPADWYRAVELYDGLCVDYKKIFKLRERSPGYTVLTFEDILNCQDDDAPPPELKY